MKLSKSFLCFALSSLCASLGNSFSFTKALSCIDDKNINIIEKSENIKENILESSMFNQLISCKRDFMISPFSIETALMMFADEDVAPDVKNEIVRSLGFSDFDEYKKILKEFIDHLNNKNILEVHNSIWLNESRLGKQLIDKINLRKNFLAQRDVVNDTDAVEKINNWVSDKTHGKITEIIDNSNFFSVVLNATYFKKDWQKPFDKRRTVVSEFRNLNGKKTQIEFMNSTGNYNFYQDNNFKMVEIPYSENNLSMYVFLPNDIAKFSYSDIIHGIKNKENTYLNLKLPKFKTETSLNLNSLLEKAGIRSMFDNQKMENYIYCAPDVLHKTFIEVDETGTEAAAVTGAILRCCMPQADFSADRPFIYAIRDNNSERILFVGAKCNF